jgi:hypothetical protein
LTPIFFIYCDENASKEPASNKDTNQIVQKYDGVTIEVDIANNNCLAILLANDGTINRKGSSNLDPKEKNFFIGRANSKAFDSLMNELPQELLQYCDSRSPECDTSKQTCKVNITFGNNNFSCEIKYCVDGTTNNLPKPIKNFIDKSITLTEPWYQEQQKLLHDK